MHSDHFYNFKKALFEAEQSDADQDREKFATNESDLEKVLKKSPKVTYTLMRLLTSQKEVNQKAQDEIRDIVTDIKIISFRPTTFRIIFKNSNYFDLVYNPSPLEVQNPEKYKPSDFFRVAIVGKRYDLSNDSEFEQALDYIGQCLKFNPIDSKNPDEEQAATSGGDSEGETGGEISDLPKKSDKPVK